MPLLHQSWSTGWNEQTDEDNDSIEGEITLDETLIAIKSLANEKSPGCDGLTAEFYKTFCKVIDNDLVEVINNGFQQGELSITMRRGVIVLIPKGGENKLLKNWRPISLLNYD